jgi:hypothetical protein
MEPRRVWRGSCPACGQQVKARADGTTDDHDHGADDLCTGSGLPVLRVREYGNAAAAAMLCVDPKTKQSIKPETYQWYVAQGKPQTNRPPGHVWVDTTVSPPQRMYDLEQVGEWQSQRTGRGNWFGEGARARYKVIGIGICPDCEQEVSVITNGIFANHADKQGVPCPRSGAMASRYTEVVEAE